MCIKRYITVSYRRYKLFGMSFFIPIVVVLVILPMIIFLVSDVYSLKERKSIILPLLQYVLPLLSLVWPCMLLKDRVESVGREVLYIDRKPACAQLLTLYGMYIVIMIVPVTLAARMADVKMCEWYKFAIQSIWLIALMYCLVYVSSSLVFSLGGIFVYVVANIAIIPGGSRWNLLSMQDMSLGLFFEQYMSFLVWAIGLFVISRKLDLLYERY